MDDFNSLSNRLLLRCPAAGIILARQFINDAWQTLQSYREWSFRRGSGVFAPPDLYGTGTVSTNVGSGQPTLITGLGTNWTPDMVGRQIRAGGLMYPYYTIIGWISAVGLLIDKPWAGPDITGSTYTINQVYFPVPDDFGYFYAVVSVKDGYRLWLNTTEADIDMMDPQRTNQGQTYAVAFRDYTPQFQGQIYQPVTIVAGPAIPTSTTVSGFTLPVAATYIVTINGFGGTGVATFSWTRIIGGGALAGGTLATSTTPVDISDGVQIYFPDSIAWNIGATWIIQATPQANSGVPRYEFWPSPTYSQYLYPYVYTKKEYALSTQQPQLPPGIANRGEVLLEMGLQKCAEFPGADSEHPNIYHDLRQAVYHENKVKGMLIDLERNDEEVGVTNIDYQMYPMYPAPWLDGQWEQRHAPFLNG